MDNETGKLKPLPLWQAILIFGILGAMVYLGMYIIAAFGKRNYAALLRHNP